MKMKKQTALLSLALSLMLLLSACSTTSPGVSASVGSQSQGVEALTPDSLEPSESPSQSLSPAEPEPSPSPDGGQSTTAFYESLPPYSGDLYTVVDGDIPGFTEAEITTSSFETYSPLDSLGRVGVAYACLGTDLMPTGERGDISEIKPTGWHSGAAANWNRSHLIGWQLSGEDANARNLMTGTREFNASGMLLFENMVADYIHETDNHVMYRVTPIFVGSDLVARGVQMEGYSVEDKGDGICFNVFVYNNQPGVTIDYATGESWSDGTGDGEDRRVSPIEESGGTSSGQADYILNTNTKKFHYPSCSSVGQMKASNREEFIGSRDEVLARGYEPCGRCKP